MANGVHSHPQNLVGEVLDRWSLGYLGWEEWSSGSLDWLASSFQVH